MVKDALGNDIVVGGVYDDYHDRMTVLDITPAGYVIYEFFGKPCLADADDVADWYPEGQYPHRDVRTWWQIMDDEYGQAPRDEFLIHYAGSTFTFQHKFRCIDPMGELPEGSGYIIEKEIVDDSYANLTDRIEDYLRGVE